MNSHQRAVHALWTKFMGCYCIQWPAWARLKGMAKLSSRALHAIWTTFIEYELFCWVFSFIIVAVVGVSTLRLAKTWLR
jgi:hypothetical protein